MAESIEILIPFGFQEPTEADIQRGKNYILRRESASHGLSHLIDSLLSDAAEQIVRLCYQFGVDPYTFQMTAKYNERLFEMISNILDNLEDDIMELVLSYSTKCTESEKRKSSLLPWILLLGRGKRNLRKTLETRLWMFSRDLEAMIVASRLSKLEQTKAVTRIKSNLHTVYLMPGMKAAFAQAARIKSQNIRTRGVKKGNVGNSNSEANNILRFGEMTLQMAWMKNQQNIYEERGAEGFYVLRGSDYDCPICDEHVGFHLITETEHFPMFHGHCKCWTIPMFRKKQP